MSMLKKTYRLRLLLLGFLSLATFAAIEVRLYYLQVLRHEDYALQAREQQVKKMKIPPYRGDILDRNGLPLATSYFNETIYLDPREFKEKPPPKPRKHKKKLEPEPPKEPVKLRAPQPKMLRELSELLRRPEPEVKSWFTDLRRHKIYDKAPEEISGALKMTEKNYTINPGVFTYERQGKRFYPNGSLAAHIIGFTTVDLDGNENIGVDGLEKEYDQYLKGHPENELIPVTSGKKGLMPFSDKTVESTYGDTLILTIDEQMQMFTEKALRRRVGEVQALGGIAIVVEVKTGQILALASCPDFDLNTFSRSEAIQRKNRVVSDAIEIGSVMKIITTTLLLDQGLVRPEELIDCQGGRGYVDGRKITDAHQLGVVPFRQAFAESSNIGLATVGLRLPPKVYYDGLARFGLGQVTRIDLPGERKGVLYELEKWTRLSRTSLPIGYETQLSAIQVACALGAVGNSGLRMRPRLVREIRSHDGQAVKKTFEPQPVERVASPETCKTVLELMEGAVTEGTGEKAQIPGYRIGGKTGTSVKNDYPRGGPRRYIASFAGLLPIQAPRLAIYVYVDEPRGEFYGGTVAAPIFQDIALNAAHILGIQPDDPAAFEQAQQEKAKLEAIAATARPTDATESLAADPLGEAEPASASQDLSATPVFDDGGPRMPNCQGMTIAEAWHTLEERGIKAQALGSGVVARQEPPAGAPLSAVKTVKIIFALPSEVIKTAATTETVQARLVDQPIPKQPKTKKFKTADKR